jgi:spore germination cell wall hydrolase CwlJ-like protein
MKNLLTAVLFACAAFVSSAQAGETRGLFTAEQRPQMWCLAQNIYYEARSSNRADRMAVADVVINRVKHTYYPNTICEVVQQGMRNANGSMKRNKCQFSWYCDGRSDWPTNQDAWIEAQMIAYNMIIHSDSLGITEGSTHYHADYVNPRWARDLQLVGRIGVHIFYRWDK